MLHGNHAIFQTSLTECSVGYRGLCGLWLKHTLSAISWYMSSGHHRLGSLRVCGVQRTPSNMAGAATISQARVSAFLPRAAALCQEGRAVEPGCWCRCCCVSCTATFSQKERSISGLPPWLPPSWAWGTTSSLNSTSLSSA